MDSAEQQADRYRRRQRGHHGLWLVLWTCILAFLAGLGSSAMFWVSEVRVVAPDPHLARAVAAALHVPAQSSALFYPLSRLERQALALPQVESVQVHRELPHQLVVEVTRRVPIALVQVERGLLMVGADGVVTNLIPPGGSAPSLPQFRGLPVEEPQPGGRLTPDWAPYVAQIAQAAVAGGLASDTIVDCSRSLDLRLTVGPVEGYLGATDNLERKVRLFAELLRELRRQGGNPAYIDVRMTQRPVWMPRGVDTSPVPSATPAQIPPE